MKLISLTPPAFLQAAPILALFCAVFAENPRDTDFERANKAVYYRTQTEREYIKIFSQCDSLKKRCDSLNAALQVLIALPQKAGE